MKNPERMFDVFDAHDVPHDEDSGVTYYPVLGGWRAETLDGDEYIYLNPSGGSDDGVPTVFLYQGTKGDPQSDMPIVHVVVGEMIKKVAE